MAEKLIHGIVPALITPFDGENRIRVASVPMLLDRVINRGAKGIYVCGYTGEAGALTIPERKLMAEVVTKEVARQVPVVVHVGATSTENAVELAKHAFTVGADAISSMAPIENKTDIDVAVAHYKAIGEATGLPFYAYQIGPQWGVTARVFLEKMEKVPNFAGLKFTHTDFYLLQRIIELSGRNLNVLSGPDQMCLAGLITGTDGAIGSTYNIMMRLYAQMFENFHNGKITKAQDAQNRANYLIDALIDPKIGDVPGEKAILNAQGIPVGNPRPPFIPVSNEGQSALMKIVEDYNLI